MISTAPRPCTACGELFAPRGGFEKKCYGCWLETHPGGVRVPEVAQLQKALARARAETRALRAENSRLRTLTETPPECDGLKERLPLIIRLCHPDRHGNSDVSNKITGWLLKKRRALQ